MRIRALTLLIAGMLFGFGLPREAHGEARFGSFGTGAGELAEPNGLAIDEARGVVYVVDTNNARVDAFTGDGRFLHAWGWGVETGRRALERCSTRCRAGLHGGGPGELGFAEGIAVDNDPHSASFGDMFVVDIDNHRVQKFARDGRFLLMFGGAVNQTAAARGRIRRENVCSGGSGDVCQAGEAGSRSGQFDFAVEGNFIAFRNGDLFVGDRNRIQVFSADGMLVSRIELATNAKSDGTRETGGVSSLVVNSRGHLYVVQHGVLGVHEYAESGAPLAILSDFGVAAGPEGPTPALAAGPVGALLVDVSTGGEHRVDEYGASGITLTSFDAGMEDGLHGMAYSHTTHSLYIVNTNGNTRPPIAHIRIVRLPPASPPVIANSLAEMFLAYSSVFPF